MGSEDIMIISVVAIIYGFWAFVVWIQNKEEE